MLKELWSLVKKFLSQFTHFKKRKRINRYGLPIFLIIAIFLTKQLMLPLLGNNSAFLMVSSVVAISSWYGGIGPGLFATLISTLFVYFAYLRIDRATHPFLGDIILTFVFMAEGLIISLASEARFEMEEQKDEFIAFAAHELKNPLAAIKGFAGLITINAKKNGNEKIVSFGESINDSTNRMLELINDLLDITKIEIGKFTYNKTFFNMNELVKEVVNHQQIINENRIIEIHGSSKNILYGDKYRIGQVIANLLTNAIKYSPETKKITVRIAENKVRVLLSVKDYGLGITKNDQKKIFSRFYRAEKVQLNKSDGLGLGLFICNQISQYHNGKLWVKSKEGRGSTFYFELPVGVSPKISAGKRT